jgi:hypothetical protein
MHTLSEKLSLPRLLLAGPSAADPSRAARIRLVGALLAVGALVLPTPEALTQPVSPGAPPGIVEFAGRLANNHWYLLGETRRPRLEELNRTLREADQQARKASAAADRQPAEARRDAAAAELVALVRECPALLRVDLSSGRAKVEPARPVELPGDTGALLLEVTSGPGETNCVVASANLAQPPGESSMVSFATAASGTTWVVASLESLPVGPTILVLEAKRPGQPAVRFPLEARTPRPGRLQVTVRSPDTGEPIPAMVRLVWRVDGLARRPSNGLDFAWQFDHQGNPGGARTANLPGPLDAPFWCVPGPFDMAVAPGIWQIGIRCGVEHEVIFEEISVGSGEQVEKTFTPRRWVDMRKEGWWSGDDHVHCRILSDDDADRLLAWVRAEDIHLANVLKMGDIYRTYFEQRGFGKDYRVVAEDTVLAPGQECPRTHDQIGHTLAMNITEMIRQTDQYFLYDTVFDAVHAQGGLTGYAHVNSGLFHVHRDMSINVPKGKVDFVELLQFNQLGTGLYYDFLNTGFKLTASAGSDVPWGGTIGEVRAYVYLGDTPFTADAWFEAFRQGHTFTTSGPMLDLRVDDARPGDEIRVTADRPLRVRARAWGDPRRMAPISLEVIRLGDVVQSARSTDPAQPDVKLEFTLPAGYGGWIAARAESGDGTHAHTTPVYVIRDGLRFWKYDAVPDLLAKRLESLRQIEEIVGEAQRLEREGKLENDRYRQQLARQGSALLERVTAARQIYADLQQTADRERTLRSSAP